MSPHHSLMARVTWLLLVCAPASVHAAPIQPFDAVVEPKSGEDVFVRSGPGIAHHYPTLKLAPGDKVRVLRKDPGGWYMIEPPSGSYSWILAAHVQRTGQQTGTVNKNGVIVRVGAFKSTQRDIEQVRLNNGDQIEIIGEQVFDSGKGAEKWYRIKPPRGEHRWVKGSFLVELNPDGTPKVFTKHSTAKIHEQPPEETTTGAVAVATPESGAKKPRTEATGPATQRDPESLLPEAPRYGHAPGRQSNSDPFEQPAGAESEEYTEQDIRGDLAIIDDELKQILDKPPAAWDLTSQLDDLKTLREMSENMPVSAEVDRKLKRVIGLQQIHQDAVAMSPRNETRPATTTGGMGSARQAIIQSPATNSSQPPPSGGNTNSSPNRTSSRFEGAGIVYRVNGTSAGMPSYLIAAPDRRILCYLDSDPTIDLGRYVGQSVGLNGRRYYEPRLRADRMLVQRVTPVRLAQ